MSTAGYKNSALPIDERVRDLLERMSLDEKIAQLGALWSRRMIHNGSLDAGRAREMLSHGIGQISRHSALMPPEESARTMNAIQRVLVTLWAQASR